VDAAMPQRWTEKISGIPANADEAI